MPNPEEEQLCPFCHASRSFDLTDAVSIRTTNPAITACTACIDEHSHTCDSCGYVIPNPDWTRHRSASSEGLCLTCYHDHFTPCERCEDEVPVDDLCDGLCPTCWRESNEEYSEDSEGTEYSGVYEHSYRVEDSTGFIPESRKGAMYMGVELEIECTKGGIGDDMRARVQEAATDINKALLIDFGSPLGKRRAGLLKLDGSLEYGFEIVTAPMEYEYQKLMWKTFGESLKNIYGIRSHNTRTCGLHVHVTRKGVLTPLHVGKILVFINDRTNNKLITQLARRNSDQWSAFRNKKLADGSRYDTDRYEAVNVQPRSTIEFRLFRGTLKTETILATLDFVHSVVLYTRDCSHSKLGYLDYLAWLWKTTGYKDLKRWLIEHDYKPLVAE